MPIRKSDIFDSDFVEPGELLSDGYSVYLSNISLVSTTSSTKIIIINPIPDGEGLTQLAWDHPVQVNDIVGLVGTSGADGYYTIESIIDDVTFTVNENIPNSTGGIISFIWPVGAGIIGVDDTRFMGIVAGNVQEALEQISFTAANAITSTEHETLRQLIHFISEGPGDGFASGAYKEVLPFGNPFPTLVTWYTDVSKTKKIIEKTIVNTGAIPSTITWVVYEEDGVTPAHTIIDNITYTNVVFEVSRTRTII